MKNNPNLKPKKIHFIGIGGNALNYLAQILAAYGFEVSGCDEVESENLENFRRHEVKVVIGNHPEHISSDIDEVIISSAVTENSPGWAEVEKAKELKIPVVKRTAYWKKLMQCGTGIAVAGTHGKTTTTAMVGYILQEAGLDPTVMVGGVVPQFGGSVRIGKLDYSVLEADEYDRAFLETRPKISVITNIDADHFDSYPGGLPEIRQAFKKFIRRLPQPEGILVAYGKDPNIRQIAKRFDLKYRFYDEDHLWPGLKLQIPGLHNQLNATAASRVAHELGIDQKTILKALKNFQGVSRRQEYLGQIDRVKVYDDYAHHPKEILATITAFREQYPKKKILVAFQPHQKRRTKELLKDFASSFNQADLTLIAPLFFVAGREEDLKISSQDISLKANQDKVRGYNHWVEFWQNFDQEIKNYDLLLILGAGDLSDKVKSKFIPKK